MARETLRCATMRSAILALTIVACAPSQTARTPSQSSDISTTQPPDARCTALVRMAGAAWPDPSTVIDAATLNAASTPAPSAPGNPFGGAQAMPAHCEVTGHIRERTGVDGMRYAIRFHMRLPVDWNGRFFFQGGGGSDGALGDATGRIGFGVPSALARGFAVLSQDSGHDNQTNSDPARNGSLAFGFDPQARKDFAYASLEVTARIGQALVRAFYGRAAERSYFYACSEGGREGMVFAQRYPELFDGIVAAAPGFALPKAAVAEAWDTRAFADLARRMGLVDSAGSPMIAQSFSDEDLAIVSDAVLAACDVDDGVTDGLVGDYRACTAARVAPALAARTCTGAKQAQCLSADQVATLRRVLGGPRNSAGEALYSDWAWDAGIGGRIAGGRYQQGWRSWKIGSEGVPPRPAANVVLGGPSLASLFTTLPTPVANDPRALLRYATEFDMDRDAPRIFARAGAFTESSWDLIGAKQTDLSAFRRRGGRLIVPHGVSDPVFSINDTMRWWDEVNAASGGRAAEFARVYPVPGMAHCGGGAATDQYDCFTAVVDWVERGIVPDRILARAGGAAPWPGRTRPLCAYPLVARYAGSGNVEVAESFVCRP